MLATEKEEVYLLKETIRRLEIEVRDHKRELFGEQETNKRLKDQLKEQMHKVHLYQIENESLIKQIDLADAKTREKEDDLRV